MKASQTFAARRTKSGNIEITVTLRNLPDDHEDALVLTDGMAKPHQPYRVDGDRSPLDSRFEPADMVFVLDDLVSLGLLSMPDERECFTVCDTPLGCAVRALLIEEDTQ